MKNKTTLAIAMAATLGCGAAAFAQQGNYPNPGYSYDQPPYGQERPDDGYSGPRSYRLLLAAAHEMDDAANYVHRQFDRNNRRPDPNEAAVSARLGELAESARHFHREVASYRGDPRHQQADFERLVRAYDRASDAMRYTSERPYLDQGMERIGRQIDRTAGMYGMRLTEIDRYRGGDRRDDRGDRYRGRDDRYRGRDEAYQGDRRRPVDDGDVYLPPPPR